jgi:hypothetical protein
MIQQMILLNQKPRSKRGTHHETLMFMEIKKMTPRNIIHPQDSSNKVEDV